MLVKKSKAASEPLLPKCLPTQCIFCPGQAELSLALRMKSFRNQDELWRHSYHKHLRYYPDGEPIDYPHPECDTKLCNREPLQNHAARIHKTIT